MTMKYTAFDRKVKDAFVLNLKVPNDRAAQSLGGVVEFQFAPKISTDNRRGNWKDTNTPGDEPIAVFSTSGPREISMTFTYVVTHASSQSDLAYRRGESALGTGGSTVDQRWTSEKIHRQLRKLRGYFVLFRDQPASGFEKLIVDLKIAGMGGYKAMTGRILDVQVKYSDTLVANSSDIEDRLLTNPNFEGVEGQSQYINDTSLTFANAFPLRTDVTLNLRLWTQLGEENAEPTDGSKPSDGQVRVPLPGLISSIPIDWY